MEAKKEQARIIEARKLQHDGHFNRLIQERVPRDLYWDEVTLECGHKCRLLPADTSPMTACSDCARAWIEGGTDDQAHS